MSDYDYSTDPTPDNPASDPLGRTQLQIWFELSLGILICLVAFTGNTLVVIAIHYDQRLNTITNMLIENLAITDIFMASLHMPFWLISLRYGRWMFGHALCQLVGLTQLVFGIASLFTMTGIAFNRYFNIVRRNVYLKYFSTRKTTYFMILFAWVGPIVATTPQLYGWGKIDYHDLFADCTCVWDLPDVSFIVTLCVVTIFLAAAVISWCYYTIYKTVKASAQRMQGHAAKSNLRSNVANKGGTESKVLKTSFVVVCVYMTCWTPLSVMGFIEVFGAETPRWAHLFAYYFVFCSSLTNPFIYSIMNPQFQQTFKKIFRRRVNDVQPVSSRANDKGTTKSTALDGQPIEDMPSTSIQAVPVFRIQNQVETTHSHNASDKTGPLVNSLPEGEDQSSAPVKPLILKRGQAWK
ncbi:visual pigment-like receptor peropsin [Oculina patagonica]